VTVGGCELQRPLEGLLSPVKGGLVGVSGQPGSSLHPGDLFARGVIPDPIGLGGVVTSLGPDGFGDAHRGFSTCCPLLHFIGARGGVDDGGGLGVHGVSPVGVLCAPGHASIIANTRQKYSKNNAITQRKIVHQQDVARVRRGLGLLPYEIPTEYSDRQRRDAVILSRRLEAK